MRRRIRNQAAGALVALAALGSAACGTMDARSERAPSGITSVAEMRSFLDDARSAASDYGQRHLGHFLELNEKALRRNGLELPPGTDLTVLTNHEGYCVEASSSEMPDDNAWSEATLASGFEGASSKDRCRL